jgi:microcystin degradation protein MlrC
MAELRIGFARISQETNALSPVLTEWADFEATHFLEGERLLAACTPLNHEAKGFMRSAELSGFLRAVRAEKGVVPVPLFSAWAVPSGPLSHACFASIEARLKDSLRAAGPLDGLFLCLHGAMGAEGICDPDARLIEAARSVVGDLPIVTSYDLHANLSAAKVAAAPLLAAYRTNPHRDHAKVGYRLTRILLDTIAGRRTPTVAWRSLPMILGGGRTIDFLAPMRPIFRHLKQLEKNPRVLTVSLFMCHPWNDHPDLGWAVHVITDDAPALAEEIADDLAERVWALRDQLPPPFPSVEEAIETVRAARLARRLGAAVVCDASDVVGAGAPGENTRLIDALLTGARDLTAFAPMRDPQAVDELWAQTVGERVQLEVGGRLDPARNRPLAVTGTLIKKVELDGFGRCVALDLGSLTLCITSGPALVMKPAFYKDLGLNLWRADIIVAKSFFPFLLFFALYNRKPLFVRTAGVTDFDAAYALDFNAPVSPRDPVDDWRPTDAQRRGLRVT